MDESTLRWVTPLFLIVSTLLQAAYLFGGKGKRDQADYLAGELKEVRTRIRDLVDFWETKFVLKEVSDARYQDMQGQINRLHDELTRITRTIH